MKKSDFCFLEQSAIQDIDTLSNALNALRHPIRSAIIRLLVDDKEAVNYKEKVLREKTIDFLKEKLDDPDYTLSVSEFCRQINILVENNILATETVGRHKYFEIVGYQEFIK